MFTKLFLPWKQISMATLVLATIILSSCSDDDDPANGSTNISVTSSSKDATTVWNTVTLTVTAADNTAIENVDIKVDGTTASTITSLPYDFAWDTQKIDDGQHTVTFVGTDKSGKQTTVEYKVTVQNVLVEIDVNAEQLDEDELGFVFLSNEAGEVIVASKFENGDHIELKAPDFDGSEFSLTQVSTSNNADDGSELMTVKHVNRGKWSLYRYSGADDNGEILGTVALSFQNAEADTHYGLEAARYGTYVDGEHTIDLSLYYSPSMLYITKQTASGEPLNKYALISSVTAGGKATIDLSQVNIDLTEETVALPTGYDEASISINGLRSADNVNESYWVSSAYENESREDITVFYPGNAFPAYYSYTQIRKDGQRAYNYHNGVYDLQPLNTTLDVTVSGTKFTGTVSGDQDLYFIGIDQPYLYWTILNDEGTQDIVIPQLPEILDGLVITPALDGESTYVDLVAQDLEGVDGYADLLESSIASEFGLGGFEEGIGGNDKGLVKHLIEPNKGGRVKNRNQVQLGWNKKAPIKNLK